VHGKKTPGSPKECAVVVIFECPLNALRQGFFDLGKLVLATVLLVVLGILPHPFFVLERVVVVVNPHDAVKRISQRPVKGSAQTHSLLFKGRNRRADFEIPRLAAFDGHGQAAVAERLFLTISLGYVAYGEVKLDVAPEEVPSLLANALYDSALGKDYRAVFALTPHLRACQSLPHQGCAEIIEKLTAEFMAVCSLHGVENRQRLPKGGRKRLYANGGRSSEGTTSCWLSFVA